VPARANPLPPSPPFSPQAKGEGWGGVPLLLVLLLLLLLLLLAILLLPFGF
jgi:hypothetical protein